MSSESLPLERSVKIPKLFPRYDVHHILYGRVVQVAKDAIRGTGKLQRNNRKWKALMAAMSIPVTQQGPVAAS